MFGTHLPGRDEETLTFTRWLGGREYRARLDPPAYPRVGWTGVIGDGGLRTVERPSAALAAVDLATALIHLAGITRDTDWPARYPPRLCLDAEHSDAALLPLYLRQRALVEQALGLARPINWPLAAVAARQRMLQLLTTGHPLADMRLVAEIEMLEELLKRQG